MIDYKGNPFYLDDEDITWVKTTLDGMSVQEKIGQLICAVGMTADEKALTMLIDGAKIGGIMYRAGLAKSVQQTHRFIQKTAKIPLLLAANLEAGGSGVAVDGTTYGKPMQAAAANLDDMGYKLGCVACREGAALGLNWSFAPIVDIDMNFRNPITNLRTFGSDPEKVISMSKGYMRAATENGLAVSIKHFPGDGVDERDQHLLTSVNSLSVEEWDKSFGKVYKALINEGAKTVMVGHIAQPSYEEKLSGKKPERIIPATLSKHLMGDLLRAQLGFNGLIVTDASQMIGFTSAEKREKAVPLTIAAGADMLLFTKDIKEDIEFLTKGYYQGIISTERLNEAVTRILALKASLKLHSKQKANTLVPKEESLSVISCSEHIALAKECADCAVTLVKDTQNLLPISPLKTKRIYLNVLEKDNDINSPLRVAFKEKLEKEGFEVTVRNRDMNIDLASLANGGDKSPRTLEILGEVFSKVSDFSSKYDLVIYVANFETASNNTVVRISWSGLMGMGNDSPWFTAEVPTMFISLANPYHLLDVPMMKTFINAYTNNNEVVSAVVEKIVGKSEFKGVSPVDAFCGRMDTKF